MLTDLEVLNGTLSPEFDIYNDIYSVDVDEDVNQLVLDYTVEEGFVVNIIDNENLTAGENEVYLQVIQGEEINTYTILVYKEDSQPVINYELIPQEVEVKKEMSPYTVPIIITSCIVIILFFTWLLFHKKRPKRQK